MYLRFRVRRLGVTDLICALGIGLVDSALIVTGACITLDEAYS